MGFSFGRISEVFAAATQGHTGVEVIKIFEETNSEIIRWFGPDRTVSKSNINLANDSVQTWLVAKSLFV